MRQQTGASEHQQYSDRQEQVSTSNTTGRSRLAPAIEQQAGADQRQQYNNHQEQVCCADRLPSGGTKKSAQPDATNTAAYRHLPIHYPIPQRRTATCPERGSARGKSGLRNSERLSPSQTCPRQSVPLKGKIFIYSSLQQQKKVPANKDATTSLSYREELHRPEAPQGRTRPLSVTGSPISCDSTLPFQGFSSVASI